MATKYNKKIAETILELKASGNHSVTSICNHVKINRDTLYEWIKAHPEFSERWESAKTAYLDNLGELAQSGLAVLLTKHEYEEVTTEYENDGTNQPKIKSVKKAKKFVMPSTAAVIFTLTNRLPENWKQKQAVEHSGKNGEPIEIKQITGIRVE
ncbi:MAG TPA: hypothetical protein VGN20_20470 [Mucilaginibacter sp.]|jgi:transposase-like protein